MIDCIFEDGNKNSLRHVVVDALVLKDNKILLVKRSHKLIEGGKWALVGGFMERNETIEKAIIREIEEEVGWTVKNIKLLKIVDNPDRRHEDRQNVAFVFTCVAVRKIGSPDDESEEIKWFNLSNLPNEKEFAFDHKEMVDLFLSCNR